MMLHIAKAADHGHKKILVRTVDTDVVVLAVSIFQNIDIDELWIHFGVGTNAKFIAVHEIANSLGPRRCTALPFFHSFTGCDTVSGFYGIGKKKAWDTWLIHSDVTETFCKLADSPDKVTDEDMKAIERFVVLMYDRTSELESVNDARMQLFASKGRTMENIPPTSAALRQHTKRSALQGGHCWGQCIQQIQYLPSPAEWGWTHPEKW